MRRPTFSIITCTWNSAAYLPAAIESVLAQDWPEIEYIFVDGGSTDNTLEMIRAVPRPVKLIENIRGGIARAMNIGIAAATGDIVAHLHSDDYYAHPHALSHVAQAFEKSGALWLFGRCQSDIKGERVTHSHSVPNYSYRRLLKGNFIAHPATFVKKSLFDRVGTFDESIKYAMDYELWLRLGRLAVPYQMDEYLAVFRRHAGSTTGANQLASFEDDYAVRMKFAGHSIWDRAYHRAHYYARRRRLLRTLELSGA